MVTLAGRRALVPSLRLVMPRPRAMVRAGYDENPALERAAWSSPHARPTPRVNQPSPRDRRKEDPVNNAGQSRALVPSLRRVMPRARAMDLLLAARPPAPSRPPQLGQQGLATGEMRTRAIMPVTPLGVALLRCSAEGYWQPASSRMRTRMAKLLCPRLEITALGAAQAYTGGTAGVYGKRSREQPHFDGKTGY